MCFKRIHILAVGICVSWPFGHFFGRFPKINKPHNLGGASWGHLLWGAETKSEGHVLAISGSHWQARSFSRGMTTSDNIRSNQPRFLPVLLGYNWESSHCRRKRADASMPFIPPAVQPTQTVPKTSWFLPARARTQFPAILHGGFYLGGRIEGLESAAWGQVTFGFCNDVGDVWPLRITSDGASVR